MESRIVASSVQASALRGALVDGLVIKHSMFHIKVVQGFAQGSSYQA